MKMRIFTIGGYGFDESTFIAALRKSKIDTFVDIRQRRGVRGSEYAFLNSSRLQALLATADVRYIYLPQLAPTASLRQIQKESDQKSGATQRGRLGLSDKFISAFKSEILAAFNDDEFVAAVGATAKTVVLFCVESQPEACHRSLVAEHVAKRLGARLEHIRPEDS